MIAKLSPARPVHGSRVLAVLLLSCVWPVWTAADTANEPLQGVAFSSITTLVWPTFGSGNTLFTKHVVSGNAQRLEIVWGEPHWNVLFFEPHPNALVIQNIEDRLTVYRGFQGGFATYTASEQARPDFNCFFGNYPISDILFAAKESDALRLRHSDLVRLPTQDGKHRLAIERPGQPPLQAEVTVEGGVVMATDIADENSVLLRRVKYEYDRNDPKHPLTHMLAQLPESLIVASFGDDRPVLTVNGKSMEVDKTNIVHHAGSRLCDVQYSTIDLGSRTLQLPVAVHVTNGQTGSLLRTTQFKDYAVASEAISDATAQALSCPLPPETAALRQIVDRYWLKDARIVIETDKASLLVIREGLLNRLSEDHLFIGEELRLLHMISIANLILGDEDPLLKHLQDHLLLMDAHAGSMAMQHSGEEFYQLALRWGREETAERFVAMWSRTVLDLSPWDSIIPYAESCLARNRFEAIYRILREVDASTLTPSQQLEKLYYTLRALDGMATHLSFTREEQLSWGYPDLLSWFKTPQELTEEVHGVAVEGLRVADTLTEVSALHTSMIRVLRERA